MGNAFSNNNDKTINLSARTDAQYYSSYIYIYIYPDPAFGELISVGKSIPDLPARVQSSGQVQARADL